MSDRPSPPPAVNPFSHPGPPPSVNPFSHPGPPPSVNPFSHPGPPPSVNPFSHPGPPPADTSASSRQDSSSGLLLAEPGSPAVPIKVQVKHTREIVCEKPVKNTSFTGRTTIVEIVPFSGTPKTITLVGNAPGDTHVTFLFTDGTADRVAVSVAD